MSRSIACACVVALVLGACRYKAGCEVVLSDGQHTWMARYDGPCKDNVTRPPRPGVTIVECGDTEVVNWWKSVVVDAIGLVAAVPVTALGFARVASGGPTHLR